MKADIIHLRYPLDAHYQEQLAKLSPMNRTSYRNQAKNLTLCWTNIHGIDITLTDDIRKVTCKKCLKTMSRKP